MAPRGARGAASATRDAGPLRVEDPCSSSPSSSSSSSESSSSSSESGGRPRRQRKTEHAATCHIPILHTPPRYRVPLAWVPVPSESPARVQEQAAGVPTAQGHTAGRRVLVAVVGVGGLLRRRSALRRRGRARRLNHESIPPRVLTSSPEGPPLEALIPHFLSVTGSAGRERARREPRARVTRAAGRGRDQVAAGILQGSFGDAELLGGGHERNVRELIEKFRRQLHRRLVVSLPLVLSSFAAREYH